MNFKKLTSLIDFNHPSIQPLLLLIVYIVAACLVVISLCLYEFIS